MLKLPFPLMFDQRIPFYVFIAILVSGLLMLQQVQADSIYVVDSSATQITLTDTALVGGNPAFVYWDAATQYIKLAVCANPSCQTGTTTITTLDMRSNLTSVALAEIDGKPFVAYADSTSGELNVIACTNLLCDPVPTPRPVNTGNYIGRLKVINRDGQPMLVFLRHMATNDNLLLIVIACTDSACSQSQEIQGVRPLMNIMQTKALDAVVVSNDLIVTFNFANSLNLMICNATSCAQSRSIGSQNISASGSVSTGLFNNEPIFVFPNGSRARLIFMVCPGEYCSGGLTTRPSPIYEVASNFVVQDISGTLKLAYVIENVLNLVTCSNKVCVSLTESIIPTSGTDIRITDLTDVNGKAGITYLAGEAENRSLRFYYEGSDTPAETETPTPISTATLPPLGDLLPTSVPAAAPTHTLFTSGYPALTWSHLTWAAAYDVEISTSSTFAVLVGSHYGIPAHERTVTPDTTLSNGTYFYRVRGVHGDGTTGQWSKGAMFIVLAP